MTTDRAFLPALKANRKFAAAQCLAKGGFSPCRIADEQTTRTTPA